MSTGGRIHVHLTFPPDLVHDLDDLVGERRRSKFVAEATRKELGRLRLLRALQVSAGAWSDKDHPDLATPDAVAGYVRRLRRESEERSQEAADGDVPA